MISGIMATNKHFKSQQMERFAEWRKNLSINTENNNRYSLLSVVFHQYQKCLQNQPGLSGEEMMQKLGVALEEFKLQNANYLSAHDYARLYDELEASAFPFKLTDKDQIKLQFLSALSLINSNEKDPAILSDIQTDTSRYHTLGSDNGPKNPITLRDNTLMLIDGYYDDLSARLKTACSDSWFAAL